MFRAFKNTDQNAANFFRVLANEKVCCGDAFTPCQYDANIATGDTLTQLTLQIAGSNTTYTLSTPVDTDDAAAVRRAIADVIYAAGYTDDDGKSGFRGIEITNNGATLTVVITGEVKAISIKTAGASAVTFNEDCTKVTQCTFAYASIGALTTPKLKVNGVDETLISIVPGTTTTTQIKTSVETALSNRSVTGTVTVTSTGSGGSTLYTVTITGVLSSTSLRLNGVEFNRSGCAALFV